MVLTEFENFTKHTVAQDLIFEAYFGFVIEQQKTTQHQQMI